MRTHLVVVAALAAVLLTSCGRGGSPVDEDRGGPAPASGSPASILPASTLPARWWLWAESTGDRNPISDATGVDCAVNQPDDVWFLAGTFGGTADRTCQIPAGRPIYFPVMNLMCEVRGARVSQRTLDSCTPRPRRSSATLDGEPLTIETATSEGSFPFEAGPSSQIASPGAFLAVAGGTWVGPLTVDPGSHVLHFAARSDTFALAVTYHLTVR